MVVNCPHCAKQLKLNDKALESIGRLQAGQKIKVRCVQCSEGFNLDRSSLAGMAANQPGTDAQKGGQPAASRVVPPSPPDIEWLRDGSFEDKETVDDIPSALILFPDIAAKETIRKAASDFGYHVESAENSAEAIEKMRFVNYAAVFLHENYEQAGLENGAFHQYMRTMTMSRRRYIFYVLVGGRFSTLYDLQALAWSANLVINDRETEYIHTILRKAIPQYEELFGPVMEALRFAGK
ncbi:hypothetical protein [Desulforhopalus singaporensis]|uniref:MJ0042 family finger-like domain-containing protein n=1 Tax=Desulforhopalus singaporensis TaxID=91360 RepID=A0A1H0QB37_9BACT|nr:hypothetical protein [Desulforhopalus singaporensis]SDP13899.1 hypothetical protein SAMN05660330_01908 [Desulforhopalus singaporensis]